MPYPLRIGSEEQLRGARARSHLGDGRVVAWTGPPPSGAARIAIDAEIERPVPAALARRHGTEDFWGRWTRLECRAKLTEVPVVMMLAELDDVPGTPAPPGLAEPALTTVRLEPEPGTVVVVSVGTLPATAD